MLSTKTEPLLLFSTNAYLAYFLAEKFYNGNHFVWCGSVFNPRSLNDFDTRKGIPTTSSPHDIYCSLKKECDDGDSHGPNLHRVKTGLMKGAGIKLSDGVINDSQYGHIVHIIENAQLKEYHPLLYAIPKKLVESKLQMVAFDKMASPLSEEYIIPNLSMNEFEIIKFTNL